MSNMATESAASRRITSLLDAGSFVEIGAGVTARSTDFNMQETKTPGDGVVTGYGVIDGNLVYVYSQDASCKLDRRCLRHGDDDGRSCDRSCGLCSSPAT